MATMKNEIKLSEHFTYRKLFKFVFPSVAMMVCLSVYSIVDGFFVSNFVGKTEFAALNLVFPLLMALASIGLMIGTGGSALVGKILGEGDRKKANKVFSMLVYATFILGVLLSSVSIVYLPTLVAKLGATKNMFDFCINYGFILLCSLPFFMLQNVFQSLFVTAEKPKIGLQTILLAGLTNIVLDYVFIVLFNWKLEGAALATAVSQFIGGGIPIIYFARKNNSLLKLGRINFSIRDFLKVVTNGSSEFMNNLASSIVTVVYNYQLLKYAGENGIAAYGTIMYIMFIFYAIYMGYCIGSAPLLSFNYGSKNDFELKNLTTKSIKIIACLGFFMTLIAEIFAYPLAKIFVGYDLELLIFTVNGLRIFAISFLIGGFNVFGSALFTALNNGTVSAVIAFLRTIVFEISVVLILPIFFAIKGIWMSAFFAETLACIVSVICFVKMKKHYNYI